MLRISGLYEVAVRVKDLAVSERFYRGTLGLEVGLRDEQRRWLFLRVGQTGMMVLQEDKGDWPNAHFAFTVDEDGIDAAARVLQEGGVQVTGPVHHGWIPARSLYFCDPNGHELELCAPVRGQIG
jgi:catechol 2,3-dioxygenase-like lactoylglutathione lyase family enzyme